MLRHGLWIGLGCLALAGVPACSSTETRMATEFDATPLIGDLAELHHPITIRSPEAQKYFDQGLVLNFGFNHLGAIRSFKRAIEIDPQCAMCYWGVGIALGPNINMPMGPEAERSAYAAVQQALTLAANTSEAERGYIETLALRYSAEPDPADRKALDRRYADAMRKLHQRYPDDLDLATLFAQSLMDLTPWDYWTPKGEPKGDTTEIVRTLEYVFKRRPDHPGANHYYIHAVEASGRPERAEAAADRLNDAELSAGHLVHMPSHIYIQVGRYGDAGEVNRRAAAADEQFFAWCSGQGVYRTLYYPHTIHFEWSAANFAGSSAISLSAGRKLAAKVSHVNAVEAPYVQQFLPSPILSLVRFGRWDAILGERKPSSHLRYPTGIWHYARGIAFARLGDLRQARAERGELAKIAAEPTVADLRLARSSGRQMLDIAQEHLKGELAARSGDYAAAVEALRQAVRLQDELAYAEPPAWYFPQRQALGAVLLEAGRPREAEQTYREDLERNPRNGWSLFGLAQSMRQQGRTSDAILVERGFAAAWEHADVKLTASRF